MSRQIAQNSHFASKQAAGPSTQSIRGPAAPDRKSSRVSLQIRAFTLHRQRPCDRIPPGELGRNKRIGIQRDLDRQGDFGSPVMDRRRRDGNRLTIQTQSSKNALSFGTSRTSGRARDNRLATAFVDRVVDGMANHRDATEFECREEEKKQQRRNDREFDQRRTASTCRGTTPSVDSVWPSVPPKRSGGD